MEKEFTPYQESLALKELGFDEPCFATYDEDRNFELQDFLQTYETFPSHIVAAPTFSQAFRWFREKYGLVIQYIPSELDNSEGQSILHHRYKISEYDSWRGGRRNTVETELNEDYEDAENACLLELINICKKK